MEKWIGLLCANVFLLKTTLAYTVVFNFTLTFTLGANNGIRDFASAVCVLGHPVVFQTGRAAMIAQFTTTKHTDHFGLVKGTN